MEQHNLEKLIKECKRGKIASQHLLYKHYYSYAMSICLRYSRCKEEAEEILNDSFFKVFTNLKKYNSDHPFRPWLRRIIINTAIDHYRREKKYMQSVNTETDKFHSCNNKAVENLEAEEILMLLRKLSNTYRVVFNLYEMEGYSHKEIADILSITEGTSRSYLKRAREKLRCLYKRYFM